MSGHSGKLPSRCETLANVLIILVCIMISAVIIMRWVSPKWPHASAPKLASGDAIAIPGAHFLGDRPTLILFLRAGCHFCTESGPLYQKIVAKANFSKRIRLLAILPESSAEGKAYLKKLGIGEVTSIQGGHPGVRGTPTLVLVNKQGIVVHSWIGKLPPNKEAEVLEAL